MPNSRPSRDDDQRHSDDRDVVENASATPLASADDVSSEALRQIVNETVSSLTRPEEVDPTLKAAMLEVARRYVGEPITVDPVGTALIEAVLRVQLPVLVSRSSLLARTARSVATKLLSDPAARLRVEHLWATLAEDEA